MGIVSIYSKLIWTSLNPIIKTIMIIHSWVSRSLRTLSTALSVQSDDPTRGSGWIVGENQKWRGPCVEGSFFKNWFANNKIYIALASWVALALARWQGLESPQPRNFSLTWYLHQVHSFLAKTSYTSMLGTSTKLPSPQHNTCFPVQPHGSRQNPTKRNRMIRMCIKYYFTDFASLTHKHWPLFPPPLLAFVTSSLKFW